MKKIFEIWDDKKNMSLKGKNFIKRLKGIVVSIKDGVVKALRLNNLKTQNNNKNYWIVMLILIFCCGFYSNSEIVHTANRETLRTVAPINDVNTMSADLPSYDSWILIGLGLIIASLAVIVWVEQTENNESEEGDKVNKSADDPKSSDNIKENVIEVQEKAPSVDFCEFNWADYLTLEWFIFWVFLIGIFFILSLLLYIVYWIVCLKFILWLQKDE